MLTGKRFKLKERTLAVEVLDGERNAVSIPAEAIVKVMPSATKTGKTLDVLWGNRTLEMFACDLNMRGMEIVDSHSKALG